MDDAQEIDALHDRHMDRAIALALRGLGLVSPNPMVGCVIVRDGDEIIGEGWHQGPGTPHAEVSALEAAGDKARGATAYVTLEPCNHHGNTGPCAEVLIEAGVGEVIYALGDPNPLAAGGAERLRAAGIKVREGVGEDVARHVNRAWLHFITNKRPFVVGKTAMTMDGRIATAGGESQWITSEESRAAGHRLRFEAAAIIAGAGTIIADDPALTARTDRGTGTPLRIVLDSKARTSPGAKVYERSGKGALLATTDAAPAARLAAFKQMGVEVLVLPADDAGRPDLHALLGALHGRNIISVLVEGGGEVLGGFFDADLLDEIDIFIAPKLFGGGKPAFGGNGVDRLIEADRFSFQQIVSGGPDFRFKGVRRKEGA